MKSFFLCAIILFIALGGALAKQVAVIENPDENFRDDVFRCHICNSKMPECEGRIDCCTEAKPDQVQACPNNLKACFKVIKFSDKFYNVTRGCGKAPEAPQKMSDDSCAEIGNDGKDVVCNCMTAECNFGSRNSFKALSILSALLLAVVLL